MSTNPFDFDDGPRRQQQQKHRHSSPPARHHQQQQHQQKQRPPATTVVAPIFSARGVEWPLPSALPPAQYRRLRRESRSLGLGMGIPGSGIRVGPGDASSAPTTGGAGGAGRRRHHHHHPRGGGAESMIGDGGGAGAPAFSSRAAGGDGAVAGVGPAGHLPSPSEAASGGGGVGGGGGGGSTTGGGGGYGGLTGLMGRVLGASSPPSSGTTNASSNLASECPCSPLRSFVATSVFFSSTLTR
jgi:hypothetical protein